MPVDSLLKKLVAFLLRETVSSQPFAGFRGIPLRAADGIYFKGTNILLLMAAMDELGNRNAVPAFTGETCWNNLGRKIIPQGKASYTVLISGYKPSPKQAGKPLPAGIPKEIPVSKIQDYEREFILKPVFKAVKTYHFSQTEQREYWEDMTQGIRHTEIRPIACAEAFLERCRYWADTEILKRYKGKVDIGEAEFIRRLTVDLALAHHYGSFTVGGISAGSYPDSAVQWLRRVFPRVLMRSCNTAYKALLHLDPDLMEKEQQHSEAQYAERCHSDIKKDSCHKKTVCF